MTGKTIDQLAVGDHAETTCVVTAELVAAQLRRRIVRG